MTNPTKPAATDPLVELRALLGDLGDRWEAWRGVVAGLLYARRRRTSSPVVFRGTSAQDVAKQIREHEEARS
jgi:hypothetical protein